MNTIHYYSGASLRRYLCAFNATRGQPAKSNTAALSSTTAHHENSLDLILPHVACPLVGFGSIFLSSKIRLMRSLVTSIFQYACESWTFTAEPQRRI